MRSLSAVFVLVLAGSVAMGARSEDDAASLLRARGQYLVEHVALCGQCHTPRGSDHELMREAWLEGAVVPVKPPYPDQTWALRAPAIAGLRGMSDQDLMRLLTRGIGRNGRPPLAPMPSYLMSVDDAQAIIAYLRSL